MNNPGPTLDLPKKGSMATDNDELSLPRIGRDSAPNELVEAATGMVNTGALPRDDTGRILAGPGEGRPCSLCAEAIGPADVEYEMSAGNARSYRFHIPCYFAWKHVAGLPHGDGGDR